ncbi:hypothetical protein H1C71_038555, partial [Ictidomys tridecemlineatus]
AGRTCRRPAKGTGAGEARERKQNPGRPAQEPDRQTDTHTQALQLQTRAQPRQRGSGDGDADSRPERGTDSGQMSPSGRGGTKAATDDGGRNPEEPERAEARPEPVRRGRGPSARQGAGRE